MELDLSSILKDCRKGTRLYSPICGELVLVNIDPNGIFCKQRETVEGSKNLVFMDDGHFKNYGDWEDFGECMLFPSKQQRDWSKFFKYGDVLKGNGMIVVFEDWVDGSYTEFNTAYDYYTKEDSFGKDEVCLTERFEKVSEAEEEEFIKKLEAKEGGVYDKFTLEVRCNPDFKDGDIIYSEWTNEEKNTHCSWVGIFKGGDMNVTILTHCSTCRQTSLICQSHVLTHRRQHALPQKRRKCGCSMLSPKRVRSGTLRRNRLRTFLRSLGFRRSTRFLLGTMTKMCGCQHSIPISIGTLRVSM